VTLHFDFRQEGHILGAILALDNGSLESAVSHIRSALETDPEMTADHWKDPLLFLQSSSWRSLLPFCERIQQEVRAPTSRALMAMCLGKAGEREEAMNLIGTELQTLSNNSTLQSIQAHLLLSSGRVDDARAALKFLDSKDNNRLARIARARVCQRSGDLPCAEQEWKALLEESDPPLAAQTGLAEILMFQLQKDISLRLINRALSRSSRYKPALRLQLETDFVSSGVESI
jgi:tetratricopeptide (TPR) repeat protein